MAERRLRRHPWMWRQRPWRPQASSSPRRLPSAPSQLHAAEGQGRARRLSDMHASTSRGWYKYLSTSPPPLPCSPPPLSPSPCSPLPVVPLPAVPFPPTFRRGGKKGATGTYDAGRSLPRAAASPHFSPPCGPLRGDLDKSRGGDKLGTHQRRPRREARPTREHTPWTSTRSSPSRSPPRTS